MAKQEPKKSAKPKDEPEVEAVEDDLVEYADNEIVATGLLPWDSFFSCDGQPAGIFIELSSKSGFGKSTMAACIAREHVEDDIDVLVLDSEGGWNKNFINAFGLGSHVEHDVSNPEGSLIYKRPKSLEEADQTFDEVRKARPNLGLVIVDSLTMLPPLKLREKGIGNVQPGLKAILEGQLLTRWKGLIDESPRPITVIFISQTRMEFNFQTKVSREKSAGPRSLGFACDVRIKLRIAEAIEADIDTISDSKKKTRIGHVLYMSAEKNRWAKPHIEVRVPVYFGVGVSNAHFLADLLVERGFITQNASFFKLPKEISGLEKDFKPQGKLALVRLIRDKCLTNVVRFAEDKGLLNLLYEV